MSPEHQAPMKILVRTPNWLGDLMMSTGFIKKVMDHYPNSHVDLVVRKGFESLPLPRRGEIHVFDRSKQSAGQFGKDLRSLEFELVYILPPSFSAAWMAFRAGISERVGYPGNMRGWLLNNPASLDSPPRSRHLLEEYLQLIDTGIKYKDNYSTLDLEEGWGAKQLGKLQNELPENFICVAAGAMYGPAKQWPMEYVHELCEILSNEAGLPILIIGTQNEYEPGEKIREGLPKVLNWCGRTSLNQMVAILELSKFLISNDSGAMHVMAALQRPQVAIFGSSSPVWTAPLNSDADVVYLGLECSPCFRRECPHSHLNCLREIHPREVAYRTMKKLKL